MESGQDKRTECLRWAGSYSKVDERKGRKACEGQEKNRRPGMDRIKVRKAGNGQEKRTEI